MRLTRNITPDGKCKYAIVRLDKIRTKKITENLGGIENALKVLERAGVIEYGEPGSEEECFIIKLKDEFAPPALLAYAKQASGYDPEYANDVSSLAERSVNWPSRKKPD